MGTSDEHREGSLVESESVSEPTTLRVRERDGIRIAEIVGDLDLSNADGLLASLQAASDGQDAFVISLEHCDYCDSHGLAMLVALSRQSAGRLVIAASRRTRRLFEITGIDKLLDVAESTEGALLRLRSKGSEG